MPRPPAGASSRCHTPLAAASPPYKPASNRPPSPPSASPYPPSCKSCVSTHLASAYLLSFSCSDRGRITQTTSKFKAVIPHSSTFVPTLGLPAVLPCCPSILVTSSAIPITISDSGQNLAR